MKVQFADWDRELQRQFAGLILKWGGVCAIVVGAVLGRGRLAMWAGRVGH